MQDLSKTPLKAPSNASVPFIKIFPIVVERSFRELVLFHYPNLDASGSTFWNVFQLLLIGFEKDGNRTKLAHRVLAACAGKGANNGAFRSRELLDAMSELIFPLDTSTYSRTGKLSRTVMPRFVEEVLIAWWLDRERWRAGLTEDRVIFVTGESASRRRMAKVEQAYAAELERFAAAFPKDHPARPITDLIHAQSPRCLASRFAKNLSAVLVKLEEMPRGDTYDYNRDLINLLIADCRCVYQAAKHTARIFAVGPSLDRLTRELRQVALAGCFQFDLRSSQLALVANLWNVTGLQSLLRELLERDESFWTWILRELDLPKSAKDVLKTAIYCLVFGGRENAVRYELRKKSEAGNPGLSVAKASEFLALLVIAELMKARDHQLDIIVDESGGVTAFGKFATRAELKSSDREEREHAQRSVLAEVVQSHELKLLLPIAEIIGPENAEFDSVRIMQFLLDGFCLWFTRPGRSEAIVRSLTEAVNRGASEAGYHTVLEVTAL